MSKSEATFRAKAPLAMRRLMRQLGLNKIEAAAIMGNAGHESAGLTVMQEVKPTVPGSKGGYGWFQWTGPRRVAFAKWCAEKRLEMSSDAANIGFLIFELKGAEAQALITLRHADGLENKVRAFEQGYERAGVKAYGARLWWAGVALSAFNAAPDANPKPLSKSRTAGGLATAGAGLAGAATAAKDIVATAGDVKETAQSAAETVAGIPVAYLMWGGLAVVLVGLGVVLYARWDDAGRPLPWKGGAQ